MSAYQDLASLYDMLMDDVDYAAWCKRYLHLTGLKRGMTALDAACGTGSLSIALAREGIAVTGVDLSGAMLRRAQEKARLAGQNVRFAQMDIRALNAPRPVDAVLCCCDGVNYLLDRSEQFFSRAFALLKSGGTLAFDISSAQKLRAMDGQIYYEDRDEVTYFWTNAFDRDRRVLKMELTFFVREQGVYQRADETHFQKAYEPEELVCLLNQAGFCDVQVDERSGKDENRIYFSARKA